MPAPATPICTSSPPGGASTRRAGAAAAASACPPARLPAGTRGVRIVSRAALPAETRGDTEDRRRLGVALRALVVNGTPIALDDARLGAGWHAVEYQGEVADFRWTDGDARLALSGGGWLDLVLAPGETYWAEVPLGRRRRA